MYLCLLVCILTKLVFLLEIFSSSDHCASIQFVTSTVRPLYFYSIRAIHSISIACLLSCRVCIWIDYCHVPRSCHECNTRAHLLHCRWHQDAIPQVPQCADQSWLLSQIMKFECQEVPVLWPTALPRLERLSSPQLYFPYIIMGL